ncbi:unnamed protein product [Ilex paraguariensis]|uniref:Uncharacterized protein n=1 Tax=Ilex paraguariensis TaxID=185542 RepID=A0ABC8R6P1_9AQUA
MSSTYRLEGSVNRLSEILGDGHNAMKSEQQWFSLLLHESSSSTLGDVLISIPVSKVDMGIRSNSYNTGLKSVVMRLNTSGVSQPVASVPTVVQEELVSRQPIQVH